MARFGGWVMGVLLVASVVLGTPSGVADASQPVTVTMEKVTKDTTGAFRSTFEMGEDFTFNVTLTTSVTEPTSNYSVRLTLPSKDFETYSPFRAQDMLRVSLPQEAKRIRYETPSREVTYAYIDFEGLTGGYKTTFPVTFRMASPTPGSAFKTPANEPFVVGADVVKDGTSVAQAAPLTYMRMYSNRGGWFLPVGGEYKSGTFQMAWALTDDTGRVVPGSESRVVRTRITVEGVTNDKGQQHSSGSYRLADAYVFRFTPSSNIRIDPNLEVDGVKVNAGWSMSSIPGTYERRVENPEVSNKWAKTMELSVYLTVDSAIVGQAYDQQLAIDTVPHAPGSGEAAPATMYRSTRLSFATSPIGDLFQFDNPWEVVDSVTPKTKVGLSYRMGLRNPSTVSRLNDVTFVNRKTGSLAGMDDRLTDLHCVAVGSSNASRVTGVRFYKRDGTFVEQTGADYVPRTDWSASNYTCQEGFVPPTGSVGFELDVAYLTPSQSFTLSAQYVTKTPSGLSYHAGDGWHQGRNRLYNHASISFRFGDNVNRLSVSKQAYGNVAEFRNEVNASFYAPGNPTYTPGESVRFHMSFYGAHDTGVLFLHQALVVLPRGADVSAPNAVTWNRSSLSTSSVDWVSDYTVVPNVDGTGRPGVRFTFNDDPSVPHDLSRSAGGYLSIVTPVTREFEPGSNRVDVYWGSPLIDDSELNNTSAYGSLSRVSDIYDVSPSSRAFHQAVTFDVTPVQEVVALSHVRRGTEAWSTLLKPTNPGETVQARARLINRQPYAVAKLRAVVSLPKASGDVYLVGGASRGSTATATLTAPVRVPSGFSVEYIRDMTPQAPHVTATRLTQRYTAAQMATVYGNDFSGVGAFVVTANRALAQGETVDFFYDVRFPADARVDDRQVFTFAVTENDPVTSAGWFESNAPLAHNNRDIDIPVTVVWDGDAQPSAKMTLVADGADDETVGVTSTTNWKHVFTGRPLGRSGKVVTYTVTPEAFPRYDVTVTGDALTGFTVTYKESTGIDISVRKVWVGEEQDWVKVDLRAGGAVVGTATLDAASNWEHVFKGMPEFAPDGRRIAYTVTEQPDYNFDYYDTITGNARDGFVVTNSRRTVLEIERAGIVTYASNQGITARVVVKPHIGHADAYDAINPTDSFKIVGELTLRDGTVVTGEKYYYDTDELENDESLGVGIGFGKLERDAVYRVTVRVVSRSDKFAEGVHDSIELDGYTKAELSIPVEPDGSTTLVDPRVRVTADDTETNVTFRGVTAVTKEIGQTQRLYYEDVTTTAVVDYNGVSGYGADTRVILSAVAENMPSWLHATSLGSGYEGYYRIGVDPAVLDTNRDAIIGYTKAADGLLWRTLATGAKEVDASEPMRTSYKRASSPPAMFIESGTGDAYTWDMPAGWGYPPREPGGRKLYTRMWLSELGSYDVRFTSLYPVGYNAVSLNIRRTLDVEAHMYNHIGSGTTDDDVFLIQPETEPGMRFAP